MNMFTQQLLFVMWISSGVPHFQGITAGSLGRDENATEKRACYQLTERRKEGKDAHLYSAAQSSSGGCDWGCEFPVYVFEVECETFTETKTRTVVRGVEK